MNIYKYNIAAGPFELNLGAWGNNSTSQFRLMGPIVFISPINSTCNNRAQTSPNKSK